MDVKSNLLIVLMCAEKEPLECHRVILVSRHLKDLGRLRRTAEPTHADGSEELVVDTYGRQEKRIAYRADQTSAGQDAPE